jgi:hypothetical protein
MTPCHVAAMLIQMIPVHHVNDDMVSRPYIVVTQLLSWVMGCDSIILGSNLQIWKRMCTENITINIQPGPRGQPFMWCVGI